MNGTWTQSYEPCAALVNGGRAGWRRCCHRTGGTLYCWKHRPVGAEPRTQADAVLDRWRKADEAYRAHEADGGHHCEVCGVPVRFAGMMEPRCEEHRND